MSNQLIGGLGSGSVGWTGDLRGTDASQKQDVFHINQQGQFKSFLTQPTGVAVAASAGSGLTASTTYYYIVTALNANGETAGILGASGTTAAATDLQLTLTWNAVPGATLYKVYRSLTPGLSNFATPSLVGSTSALTLVDTGAALSAGAPPSVNSAYVVLGASVPSNPYGRIYSDFSGESNTSSTSAQTLCTFSLPAGQLASTGQGFRVRAWGTSAANTDSKALSLLFGSATLVSVATTTSGVSWSLEAECFRTGAATQAALGRSMVGTALALNPSSPTQTLSSSLAIALSYTGSAGVAADVTVGGFEIELIS